MHRRADDEGTTLVELLVAIALLGILVTAILTAMATSTQTTRVPVQQADLDTYLRNWAEVVAAVDPTGCALPAVVAPAGMPTGYVATSSGPTYWNGSTWGSCPGSGSTVPQRWVLSIRSGASADVHTSTVSLEVTRYDRTVP